MNRNGTMLMRGGTASRSLLDGGKAMSIGVALDMAKKAGGGKPKKKPGPVPTGRLPVALTVKGSPEWKEWIEAGAKFCLTDVSKLVDIAVTKYLREQGFDKPRPDR
jgi:hypothetical protein